MYTLLCCKNKQKWKQYVIFCVCLFGFSEKNEDEGKICIHKKIVCLTKLLKIWNEKIYTWLPLVRNEIVFKIIKNSFWIKCCFFCLFLVFLRWWEYCFTATWDEFILCEDATSHISFFYDPGIYITCKIVLY